MSVCIPTGAVLLSRACDASHHAPPLNCLSVALRRLESDPCTLSLASCRLEWFSQIATTVAQCHAYGLTHGQLRPEHVLLSADGQTVKLLGFDPQSWRQVRFGPNLDGQLALRPPNPHDAPELSGRTHASASELAAADMWSLGVLLTAVLVEYPPVYDHSTSLIQWPQALHAAPPALRHLLECLLHPQPSQRPLSAAVAAHAHALLRSRAQCAPMASGLELSKASAPPPPSTSSSTPLDSLRSENRCEGRCEGLSSSDLDRRLPEEWMPSGRPRIEPLPRFDRTESTHSLSSAENTALPDDLSEAPTRASSLRELEESVAKRPALSKCEMLYVQLRMLEARDKLDARPLKLSATDV